MIALLMTGCLLLGQAEVESKQLASQVNKLVRQLDHDELAQREAAERALIALGPAILELLPATDDRTPAEVKQRLRRLVKELENQAAASAAQPSAVTLKGRMPLSEAMGALEAQTGNRIIGFEAQNNEVSIDFDKTPYWEALDQLLDQIGMNIDPYGGQGGAFSVVARPEEEIPRFGHAVYSGVFRFEPLRIQGVRDLRNPAIAGLRLALGISWEPRSAPISVSQDLAAIEAYDENGKQLMIDGDGQRGAAVQTGVSVVELELPFLLPDRGVKEIATLKGELTALVPGRVESFRFFRNLETARAVEMRKAGVTVILDQVRKNQQLYEVLIRVRFAEAANALESHSGWVYSNEAFIVNAKQQRINHVGLQATRQEQNEVGVAYLFDLEQGIRGCTFVYKTPALIVKLPVPYELQHIPLP